jgi:very-short-patch-repair endonuclease
VSGGGVARGVCRRPRLHRGVYAVGHAALSVRGQWMAAVFASGAGAVLSHRAAAALWEIREATIAEVTTPRHRDRRAGIVLHRCTLDPDQVTVRHGIPATTVARTLIDLAAVLPRHQLERALNEAHYRRLLDPSSLDALIARHRRRRGLAALRGPINDQAISNARTRSELEARFLAFLDAHQLPRPRTNLPVHGYECDCVWAAQRLIAELDGHAAHATRAGFEADRHRDRTRQARGWRTVRITWRQLHRQEPALARDLRALLA